MVSTTSTNQIARRVHFVRDGKNWKIHKIDWCEEGLQSEDIATKNVYEHDLTNRIKYIMVSVAYMDIYIFICGCGFLYEDVDQYVYLYDNNIVGGSVYVGVGVNGGVHGLVYCLLSTDK